MRFLAGLLLLLILLGAAAAGFSAEKKLPLRDTPAWIQLSRLWRQMSEHWAGKTVSHQQFDDLGDRIQEALPTLVSLQARDYFDEETRKSLEEIFQRRYLFIRDQRYRLTGTLNLVDLDYYAFTSRSRMEELLAALLWPPEAAEREPKKMKEKRRKDLAVELEFLRRATALRDLISVHRVEAEKRQSQGLSVDWNQFNLAAMQRTRALIDDYTFGRIKPGKETLRLQKYLLSLTEEELPPLEPSQG